MLPYFPFLEAAYMAKMAGGSAAKDSRIAIIEKATEFGRVEFANTWDIRVKMTDELNGQHFHPKGSNNEAYSIYAENIFWSCYYKNDEFMFALPYEWYTNAEDYYNDEDGVIYKRYDRHYSDFKMTGIDYKKIDHNGFCVVQVILSFSYVSTNAYYKSDGTIDSQSINESSDTIYIGYIDNSSYSKYNVVIARGDWQTYINDVMDFTSTV